MIDTTRSRLWPDSVPLLRILHHKVYRETLRVGERGLALRIMRAPGFQQSPEFSAFQHYLSILQA